MRVIVKPHWAFSFFGLVAFQCTQARVRCGEGSMSIKANTLGRQKPRRFALQLLPPVNCGDGHAARGHRAG
jgi:hypothetical protein